MVTADATGTIQIRVVPLGGGRFGYALGGVAIREIPARPGLTVIQSGDSTQVSETGTTDTFTVRLNTQPTANVVVNVTSGDLTEATVGPASLTFTPGNWDSASDRHRHGRERRCLTTATSFRLHAVDQ